MIAVPKPTQVLRDQHRKQFERMLPLIVRHAKRVFDNRRADVREELIAEAVAHAYGAFAALVHRGKAELAYATPLARFAVLQVLSGRRLGSQLNSLDLHAARDRGAVFVEQLVTNDHGQWRETLVEDRRATPAEIATMRIDFAFWLTLLSEKRRFAAIELARGETTRDVARQLGVSSARISQLRLELKAHWERFQGGVNAS